MAITNHERVGKALELLKDGLAPFVLREFIARYKTEAVQKAMTYMDEDRINANKDILEWDISALIKLMLGAWTDVFKTTLGHPQRTFVNEIRDWRNKWAHQEPFSGDDAYRALDSMARLLAAISASQADEVNKMKLELSRVI
jgi:hypothetical protein